MADRFFHNSIVTALGGTWGENVGYYGTIVFRDVKEMTRNYKTITPSLFMKLIRNLLVEFGPAEYLDSFFVRPFAMYVFPKLLGNVSFGLIVGKFAADGIFYIPTIISLELRKKYLKS